MLNISSNKLFVLVVIIALAATTAYAYQIPYNNSNVKYFYVFGKDGDPLMGKEDSEQEIFIDVPHNASGDVTIEVIDPDVGGTIDWKKPHNDWNTTCEFSVTGAKLLDKKQFGNDPEYDRQSYAFGPYAKTDGEKVGNFYRFKLKVVGLSGDDENLFKVNVSPRSAESFVYNITFRLLPNQGDEMYFYPEISADATSLTVENYDLDITGGSSTLSATPLSKKFPINDSESGEWRTTDVQMNVNKGGRVVYKITKGTQRYANAGLRIKDDKGNLIPLYFRKGVPVVVKEKPVKRVSKPRPKPAPKKDMTCNEFTFDATKSYDIDRQNLSYLWNFGDGQTSTEPVVTHVYEKAGEYTVKLTVTDDSGLPCDSGDTMGKVFVNTPPEAAIKSPDKSCLTDSITFDASSTKDNTPGKLTYFWNLGDGNKAEGKIVNHTYTKGGKYVVTLSVDDNADTKCSTDTVQKSLYINTSPVADAGNDISKCLKTQSEEYTVKFDGARSSDADGDTLDYVWNLGDGTTATGQKVKHIYPRAGTYKVVLTVDDGTGLACSTSTDVIVVELNRQPVAIAGADMDICAGETVTFDGSSSKSESSNLSYNWDLGDGNTARGAKVTHTYEQGGNYIVNLAVDDGKGTGCSTATDSLYVTVNGKPQAVLEDVEDACTGDRVTFNASGSSDSDGDVLSYTWDFGEGTQEKGGSKASHVYQKGGTYYVTVTVDDGTGSKCSSSIDSVRVKINTPPEAAIKHIPACCVDMVQKFDASSSSDPDGDSLSYMWDLGDGTTKEGAKVSHVYTEPGIYKIVLTVEDGSRTDCSTATDASTIVVNAKPVAIMEIK